MALSCRLFGKNIFGCHGLRCISAPLCRQITLQSKPSEVPIPEGHDERNMRLCRPLSPHLTIYKFQLPANLSITHRFTGMILSGYAATFAAISLLSNKPMLEVVNNISTCYPNFFVAFKVGLIFPFCYHFFNGIRHLIWDTGSALSLKGVYITGYLMLVFTILTSAYLVYYAEELKRIENELHKKKKEEEKLKKQAEQSLPKKKKKGKCDKV